MTEADYQLLTKDIESIKAEQQRLRDEQERLRHETETEHEHTGDKKSSNGGDQHKSDSKKDDCDEHNEEENKSGESQSKNGKDDKSAQDKKDGDKHDDEDKPKPPLKERVRTYTATHQKQVMWGAIGFGALCIIGFFLVLYLMSYESTDDAQVDGHLIALSPRVSGTVLRVYVEDGQTVATGQLIAELDPRDLDNALQQAKANYANAEAQLKAENPNVPIVQTTNQTSISSNDAGVQNAQAAVLASEKNYQAKLAAVNQAEANDAKAQRDLIRYRALVEKEEISHEQYDGVVAAAKTQSAGVTAAKADAEAAQRNIDQTRAQLNEAQARLNESRQNAPRNVIVRQATLEARQAALLAAQAQMDQAALNLSYSKIYAPAAGIITSKTVEVGERIEPGEQLLVLSQTSDIWITANFKETQLRKMRRGQPVDISVDTYSGKYHGYIESMPGATGARTSLLPPENATGNFVKVVQRLPVRIRLNQNEDRDHLLRPGMSVEPKVWLNKTTQQQQTPDPIQTDGAITSQSTTTQPQPDTTETHVVNATPTQP
jgi:membrane fusion protein, multidrug efflux system